MHVASSVHLGFYCLNGLTEGMQYECRMDEKDNNPTYRYYQSNTKSNCSTLSMNFTLKFKEFSFRLGCDWLVASLQHNTEWKDGSICQIQAAMQVKVVELRKTSMHFWISNGSQLSLTVDTCSAICFSSQWIEMFRMWSLFSRWRKTCSQVTFLFCMRKKRLMLSGSGVCYMTIWHCAFSEHLPL